MTENRSRAIRYGSVTIWLHWLMLALLAAVYAAIELRELFARGSDPRELLKAAHFSLGLAVFALVWVRLLARRAAPTPPIAPKPPAWQHAAAALTHGALYLLMIALPIAGWIILSAEGDPIPFFGLELPPLTGPNQALAERVEQLHKLGGTIGYYLIGLHAAAALAHHYWLRDDTLRRILPTRA